MKPGGYQPAGIKKTFRFARTASNGVGMVPVLVELRRMIKCEGNESRRAYTRWG